MKISETGSTNSDTIKEMNDRAGKEKNKHRGKTNFIPKVIVDRLHKHELNMYNPYIDISWKWIRKSSQKSLATMNTRNCTS